MKEITIKGIQGIWVGMCVCAGPLDDIKVKSFTTNKSTLIHTLDQCGCYRPQGRLILLLKLHIHSLICFSEQYITELQWENGQRQGPGSSTARIHVSVILMSQQKEMTKYPDQYLVSLQQPSNEVGKYKYTSL